MIAVGLAAPAFCSWAPQGGNWAAAPAPANIVLSNDGRNVLDTPEVAQARAAHLAALSQAQSQAGNSNDDGSYDSRWEAENYQEAPAHNQWNAPAPAPVHSQWNSAPQQGSWKNQPANIALSADGKYVLDTPEVAQARAAHLAAYAGLQGHAAPAPAWNSAPAQSWNAAPAQSWNAAPAQSWNAAPAPAWNHGAPASVADTPEVAQARAAHAAAHAAASAAAGPAQNQWNAAPAHNQWNAAPAQNQWNAAPAHQNSWASAPSQIALSHDGQNVLDTPEVAQARAAHLAAHAAASAGAAPARHW